jgi:parvulin-like peptidyl-prolyl isomerase
MIDLFKVNDRVIDCKDIAALLRRYQLMPQLIQELIIDEAIADLTYTDEEKQTAILQFCQQRKFASPEAGEAWMKSQGMSNAEFETLAMRPVLLEKFKQAKFAKKVQSYFLERKSGLDYVVYSLVRTQDEGLAHELYHRILEGEQTFAQCAAEYSQGPEARTGGQLGPVPIGQPHPAIGKLLSVSQPGQLWPPRALAEWFIIIRLEQFHAAQLDDGMRQRLLEELYQNWLQEKIQNVSFVDLTLPNTVPALGSGDELEIEANTETHTEAHTETVSPL